MPRVNEELNSDNVVKAMKRNRSKRVSAKSNAFLARVYNWRVDHNYGVQSLPPQQYQQFQHINEYGELTFVQNMFV